MRRKGRFMTAQECVEYADKKAREAPESLRLQVYWGTIVALAINPPVVGCEDAATTDHSDALPSAAPKASINRKDPASMDPAAQET